MIDDSSEFEQALAQVERSLRELKERYGQVQRDSTRQMELQNRQKVLKQQQKQGHRDSPLKTELRQIQTELETLELNLESRLFNWKQWREPFWDILRFGGLGIIIGWILKSYAGG